MFNNDTLTPSELLHGITMTSLTVSGLPALAWAIGFVVIGSIPVWFAAKITDASNPTLLRSALALFVGTAGSVVGFMAGGGLGLLIAPIAYLLAFKFILGTSFLGAIILGILALLGYFILGKAIGGGFSLHDQAPNKEASQTAIYQELRVAHPIKTAI